MKKYLCKHIWCKHMKFADGSESLTKKDGWGFENVFLRRQDSR